MSASKSRGSGGCSYGGSSKSRGAATFAALGSRGVTLEGIFLEVAERIADLPKMSCRIVRRLPEPSSTIAFDCAACPSSNRATPSPQRTMAHLRVMPISVKSVEAAETERAKYAAARSGCDMMYLWRGCDEEMENSSANVSPCLLAGRADCCRTTKASSVGCGMMFSNSCAVS